LCVCGRCCCVPAGGHGACVGVAGYGFHCYILTKKGRIWPALREASTPQMLRALYAAVSLRFGKFLISDPGVSLFGILPRPKNIFVKFKNWCWSSPLLSRARSARFLLPAAVVVQVLQCRWAVEGGADELDPEVACAPGQRRRTGVQVHEGAACWSTFTTK
jgi:hypothetical protein